MSTRRMRERGKRDLIYTSVVTKTGDALATAVRHMGDGSGFIYHCSEGQRGSRVLRDYTDLEAAEGLLPTFIGIHCCAVDAGELGEVGREPTRAASSGRRCRTSCCMRRRR